MVVEDFATMAVMASFLTATSAPHRLGALALTLLAHWLFYWFTIEPSYRYVCKCAEDLLVFDVPLSKDLVAPAISGRGDTTVTAPRPLASNASAAAHILSTLSALGSVRFVVDAEGRVRNCTIDGRTPSANDRHSICRRIRPLRFSPALNADGQPVAYIFP